MPDSFPFTMAYTALFEKGAVELNSRSEKTLAIYRPGKEVEYPRIEPELEAKVDTGGNIADLGGYFSEIKYFIDCLENNEEPSRASAQSARDSLEIALSEMKSADSGEIIEMSRPN